MIVSLLIIVVSVALFFYWFRYTCILILNTCTTRDFGAVVAEQNGLQFAEVQGRLSGSSGEELFELQAGLERDYQVVSRLLKQAADLHVGGDSLEELMLRIDFRIMSVCYQVCRRFSHSSARTALEEMCQIVAHFANACGERAAQSASA